METPDTERGCRTKIPVQGEGDAERLWRNWPHGLHCVTCGGDLGDLRRRCRFKDLAMVDETA